MVVFVRPASGMAPNPMSPPEALPAFLERNRGKSCPYCAQPFVLIGNRKRAPTRDHIRPRRFGGGPILVCCMKCNNDKGSLFLSEWIEQLRIVSDSRVSLVKAVAGQFPDLARRPADLRVEVAAENGKRMRRLLAIQREAAARVEAAPDRMPGLERTPREKALAACGSRTPPWIPCAICRLYFPRAKALEDHTRMKHGVPRSLSAGISCEIAERRP
jgi:hypothetical protein